MKNLVSGLAMAIAVAGCQTTTGGEEFDAFAKTRQPVPEVPQFRNGKPTGGKEAAGDSATEAAPAPARKPQRTVVEYTAKRSALSTSFRETNVTDVVVDMSEADKGFGWAFTMDKARAAQIADQVLTSELEKADNDRGKPIVVTVKFDMLYLASGAGILLGSPNSSSRVTVNLRDKASNAVTVRGARVNAAGSRRIGGLLAAGQVGSEEEELVLVARGLAGELQKALFKE